MPLALLGLHAVLALAAPVLVRPLGRRVFLVCALAPLATTVWALTQAGRVIGAGTPVVTSVAWAPSLGLSVDLRLDAFALLMVLLVSGIGTLIFGYATGYFATPKTGLGGFAGALTGFAGSMLGLVLADNVLLIFVFWELTSITSFLLIGTDDTKPESRSAALQALLTTGAGGLALLAGLVLLGQAAGTYSFSEILANPPSSAVVSWALVLALLGAFTKSAQVPFHFWLPSAMAAPTPVSAYLHSATMVKGGVYLIARMAPAFALVPVWRPLVLTVGAVTMLVGAYRALREHDLKLLLAYGTVSQLGFMVVMFGIGTPEATFAAAVLILAHGLFKAALFLVVGAIDVQTGTRDIRELSGLRHSMPLAAVAAVVAVASMAGLPPLLGFLAKEAAFEGLLHGGFGPLGPLTLTAIVSGSAITVAYSARFVYGAFGHSADEPTPLRRRAGWLLSAPPVLLAVLTVANGLVPLLADDLVNAASQALDPRWESTHLKLWHGFNAALGLSVLAVAGGTALFLARSAVERMQARVPAVPSARGGYNTTIRGVLTAARRTTGVVQNGSLPLYLWVILLTVLVLPAGALVGRTSLPLGIPWATNGMQAALCVIAVVAAIATTAVARRFAAVLLLGAVGYSVAALFVLHGAPDLALTQMLVETLSLVIFVLVLRHLPAKFGRRAHRIDRWLRAAVAGAVGLGVFLFALVAAGVRTATPVSEEHLARSLSEAEGRNVVNVILVDFRALDTFGEITVLLTAALGIASLVFAGRISRTPDPAQQQDPQA